MAAPTKKHWSRTDEERRLCGMWLQDPLLNPSTGLAIERNGPTFNSWKQRCKDAGMAARPVATGELTFRKCQEWRAHPHINPDSGHKIKPGGPTFEWLDKQCKLIEEKALVLLGEYYTPDRVGMVPTICSRGTNYIVRTIKNETPRRQVWGPLNKPAQNIQLNYYMDTWDFRNNHYKPVFVNHAAPTRQVALQVQSARRQEEQSQQFGWLHHFVAPIPKSGQNPKKTVDRVIDLFISKDFRPPL